jgi:hypothetical protein
LLLIAAEWMARRADINLPARIGDVRSANNPAALALEACNAGLAPHFAIQDHNRVGQIVSALHLLSAIMFCDESLAVHRPVMDVVHAIWKWREENPAVMAHDHHTAIMIFKTALPFKTLAAFKADMVFKTIVVFNESLAGIGVRKNISIHRLANDMHRVEGNCPRWSVDVRAELRGEMGLYDGRMDYGMNDRRAMRHETTVADAAYMMEARPHTHEKRDAPGNTGISEYFIRHSAANMEL